MERRKAAARKHKTGASHLISHYLMKMRRKSKCLFFLSDHNWCVCMKWCQREFRATQQPDVCFHHTSPISIWSRNAVWSDSMLMCVYLCIQMHPGTHTVSFAHTHSLFRTHVQLVVCVGGLRFIRDCLNGCKLVGFYLSTENEHTSVQQFVLPSKAREKQGLLDKQII